MESLANKSASLKFMVVLVCVIVLKSEKCDKKMVEYEEQMDMDSLVHSQSPAFKFRFAFFPFKSCVILAIC